MRFRRRRAEEPATDTELHDSVPNLAFEFALYRMRNSADDTSTIIRDYLRELGA